jgi:hypothetical protein
MSVKKKSTKWQVSSRHDRLDFLELWDVPQRDNGMLGSIPACRQTDDIGNRTRNRSPVRQANHPNNSFFSDLSIQSGANRFQILLEWTSIVNAVCYLGVLDCVILNSSRHAFHGDRQ